MIGLQALEDILIEMGYGIRKSYFSGSRITQGRFRADPEGLTLIFENLLQFFGQFCQQIRDNQ